MNVALLTGGGDCPGLNAVIRAVTRQGLSYGWSLTGIRDGWRGLLERRDHASVSRDHRAISCPWAAPSWVPSRTNPYKLEDGPETVMASLRELGIDALIAIGGDDTLSAAKRLYEDHGIHVVGVPKTIDNDLSGTDSPSASTPPLQSPPRPSTGCTPRPNPTTG